MKYVLLLLAGWCSAMLCTAQTGPLYFKNITTANGLPNNVVNCIMQDHRGFTWIGTNDGLSRYDGNNFVVFRNKPGDSTSIGGNIITDILEDEKEVLWIATSDGGLSRYNYRLAAGLQFKQYKHLPNDSASIPVNSINALLQDKQGYLWLGTNGRDIIRFSKTTGRFNYPIPQSRRTILDLCSDRTGTIWAGRQGGSIIKADPATLAVTIDKRYDNLYERLPHTVVTSLFSSGEDMWYGSWDKLLYRYNLNNQQETVYTAGSSGFLNDEISCFARDKQGRLWMGGKTKGLQLLDMATGHFVNFQHNPLQEGSLLANTIHCIFTDQSGRVWIGTSKGISVYSATQQQFTQTFLPAPAGGISRVYDFYKDENGDLWIGTSAGIYLRRNNTAALLHYPLTYKGVPLAVTKFYMDSRGRFFIGTNYSLFVYNRQRNQATLLPNTENDKVMYPIIESRVVSMAETSIDGKPVLLVSPYGHYLTYYDLEEQHWVSRLDTAKKILKRFNLKDNLVHQLYKSPSGQLWLANAKEGLGQWQTNAPGIPSVVFYQNDPASNNRLTNNHVYAMTAASDNNLWVSTYGGGLNYFETTTGKATYIPASPNLLEGIATDRKGNVWMVSNGNLHRYDISRAAATSFTLPDLEKSGGISGPLYSDAQGKLYAAGKNYFICFDPDTVLTTGPPPAAHFSDFRIFNQSHNNLLQQSAIRLSYRQNYFTIEFAAPDYASPEPVQYAYMLEGFDKTWVECGNRNFAPYANLAGGTYTFRVRASTNAGTWNESAQRLTITIIPPFWKQWWFFVLCGALLAGVVYGIYRYRINELLKLQAIRNKIAQDLHDNVGSTLSSVAVYSQVAQIQSDGGNREMLNEVLGKISTTSNDMISEMNDIVWAINPRNDSMEKILQRMESFARPLVAARNIRFDFSSDKAILSLNLDMEKRKNFYLIFKEAVNNAVKYSGAAAIRIVIRTQGGKLYMEVNDDGVGFNVNHETNGQTTSLSGNGLRNMQVRAAEMKGTLDIVSHAGKGSSIRLVCPIP